MPFKNCSFFLDFLQFLYTFGENFYPGVRWLIFLVTIKGGTLHCVLTIVKEYISNPSQFLVAGLQ